MAAKIHGTTLHSTPWASLKGKNWPKYIQRGCLPDDLDLDEPWKLNSKDLNNILDIFDSRLRKEEELLVFIADPKPAAKSHDQREVPTTGRKRKIPYVEVDDNEEEDGGSTKKAKRTSSKQVNSIVM